MTVTAFQRESSILLTLIGTTLSHFKITAKLGEGGMGEVYRAEDTKLGREVALKVLPTEMASGPERLERFSREAQAIAALTHPNIVTIYSVEEADGIHLLTMELVEGESLDEILPSSGFELERLFPLAIQIADALAAAHEKGITHRDLKPANVMVTAEGRVKVLDFGLAKLAETEAEPENAPTQLMTQAGMILGTVPYMSPEQVQGKPVDPRSDIFSFGILLYEMATGERPFQGDDPASVISAVLKDKPPAVTELKAELPNHLGRIVRRCLEKSPQRRFQSARDVQLELEELEREVATTAPSSTLAAPSAVTPPPRSRPPWLWPAGALAAAIIAGLVGWSLRPEAAEAPVRKLVLDVESVQTRFGYHPQISPDGSRILYSEHDRIWVRGLAQLASVEIPGSLGGRYACWSPDSQQIAFVAAGRLWRVDVAGGRPTPIAPFPEAAIGSGGMVWLADGRIVMAGGRAGLLAVPDQGGSLETLLAVDPDQEFDFHELGLLPDARRILFVAHRRDPDVRQRLVDTIAVWTEDGRKDLLFLEGDALQSVAYSPTGHLLFHRANPTPGLWAVDFDLENLAVSGQPFMVTADSRLPSVAADGTLLMVHGLSDTQWELVRVDSRGRVQWSSGHSESDVSSPALSPDGTRVAASAGGDIWIYDIERSTRTRMTLTPTFETHPEWSPSGDRLVFSIIDAGRLATVPASGGDTVPLGEGILPHWTPDGESILYSYRDPDTSADAFYRLPPAGGEPQRVFETAAASEREGPRLSPDGRLLAYSSDEFTRFGVYVERFPTGSGRWRISTEGGRWPRWSRDGDSLYFLSGARLAGVRVLERSPPTFSTPEVFFSLPDHRLAVGEFGFEVGPDESFFMAREVDDPAKRAKLALVQNWFGEFEDAARAP